MCFIIIDENTMQIEEQQAIEDGNEDSNNDNVGNDVKTEYSQQSIFNTMYTVIIIFSKYLF